MPNWVVNVTTIKQPNPAKNAPCLVSYTYLFYLGYANSASDARAKFDALGFTFPTQSQIAVTETT